MRHVRDGEEDKPENEREEKRIHTFARPSNDSRKALAEASPSFDSILKMIFRRERVIEGERERETVIEEEREGKSESATELVRCG